MYNLITIFIPFRYVNHDWSEWYPSAKYSITTEYTEKIKDGDKVVIYGEIVDDFHFLDKNAIFTVATAALQEVDRQLQAEKAKTALLETQMADVLSRLAALEST